MLQILSIVIFLITFNSPIMKNKHAMVKNFILVYFAWWSVWLAISQTSYANIFPLADDKLLLFLINVFSFIFGIMFIDYLSKSRTSKISGAVTKIYNKSENNLVSLKVEFNQKQKKIFLLFQLLIVAYYAYYAYKYGMMIKELSPELVRIARFEIGYLFGNLYEAAFYSYIMEAIMFFLNFNMCLLMVKREYKNRSLYIQLIAITLSFLVGFGRLIFFEIIIYYVMANVIVHGKDLKNIIKNNYKKYILVFSILFIALILASLKRMNGFTLDFDAIALNIQQIFEQGILYFMGGTRAFSHAIEHDYAGIIYNNFGSQTFGMSSLAGFNQIVTIITNILGGNLQSLNDVMGSLMQKEILIGQYQTFNAFYTSLFNYYVDFGLSGLFIIPFVYGIFIDFLFKVYERNKNVIYLIFLGLNLSFALFTVFKWYYQALSTTIMILLMIMMILYFKYKQRKNKESDL